MEVRVLLIGLEQCVEGVSVSATEARQRGMIHRYVRFGGWGLRVVCEGFPGRFFFVACRFSGRAGIGKRGIIRA